MKILSINSGSSTIKFALFEKTNQLSELFKGQIETTKPEQSLPKILKELQKKHLIQTPDEIKKIGHRIVHGGEAFSKTTVVTSKVIKSLWALAPLAPLHNPINLRTLEQAVKLLPNSTHITIFDTAFYSSLPPESFRYALPEKFYKKHQIRRYGFHGINHEFVTKEALRLYPKNKKIISCHLGNGSSITASLNGKAKDTSMGFTPLEGIPMGTRSGSIDPGILLHMATELKITPQKINHILNYESGLLGISNLSSDMRKIYAAHLKGNAKGTFTINFLAYQIAKTINSFLPAIGIPETLIFTGGMGEHAFYLRSKIIQHLNHLNITINPAANSKNSTLISTKTSKTKILIIPANEERAIAEQIF